MTLSKVIRESIAAKRFSLTVIIMIAVAGSAAGFYYPPTNVPPGPPPNYNTIDTTYFDGTPAIPVPPPDSGGIFIYRDSGRWNIVNHIYSKGGSLEQFHGAVLAVLSQPPTLNVNVFFGGSELWVDTSANECLKQNDRWGWVQWGDSLYEIWWDVTTREYQPNKNKMDVNDSIKVVLIGCAIDFNLWSSGHNAPFGPDQIYLGQSMTPLASVVGYTDTSGTFVNAPFVDTYPGISDPYQSQAGTDPTKDPNITIFTPKALPGNSYNANGVILPTDSYPCDPTYGQRYAGSFAYEGNGIQFATHCGVPTNVPPVLTVTTDTSVFLCAPTQICIQLHGEDDDGDLLFLSKQSGVGSFVTESSDSTIDTVHCFTPDTSGTYCFVFNLDDDALLRGVIESSHDEDTI
ncbi:MAG: hypothetical protein D6800_09085, partial [Candidatus Zixiibacteriota bacterium]